jgi:hypothetical protein
MRPLSIFNVPLLMKRCIATLPLVAILSLGHAAAQSATTPPPAAAAPPPASGSQLVGRIEGDTYVSATGMFRIKIPVLPALGGAITDTQNVVTFDDDYSVHTSVAAFPLSKEVKWEYESRGPKDFLVYFFNSFVMPDFAARFPGAKTEENATFLPKLHEGALLVYTLLPGGSFFEQRVRLYASLPPTVAKRGNLCFVKNGCFFVISTELAERALERSTYNKSVPEENAMLRQRLMSLLDKMEFLPPPPEAKG